MRFGVTGSGHSIGSRQQARSHVRVAALYDIHGNLPALEAVLYEVRHVRVDQVVIGGDAILRPPSEEAAFAMYSKQDQEQQP